MSVTKSTVLDDGVWRVDRSDSTVGFAGRHFGVSGRLSGRERLR
jgi:polyisoprenoid-binding protein YceI